MKRRRALQGIAVLGIAIPLLPGCKSPIPEKIYENLLLETEQRSLIQSLINLILPVDKKSVPIETPETTLDFVLTYINDCFEQEEIDDYLAGLNTFIAQYRGDDENNPISFQSILPEQQNIMVAALEEGEDLPKELAHFYHSTKGLTIRHFTSSEMFMTKYLDFEFVPGRFSGCVSI